MAGIVVIGALESVPGVPGHQRVSLLGDLVTSDGAAAATEVDPFARGGSTRPCPMLESRYEAGNHLLRDYPIGFYARIWSAYQALEALYVASVSPGERSCLNALSDNLNAMDSNYWDTPHPESPGAFDQGPHAFHLPWDLPRVDDSLWMGLVANRTYVMTRDPVFLHRAEAAFAMAVWNWDPKVGGIYWEYHTAAATDYSKTIVSNAPAALLGAALFAETAQVTYLTWSERILDWLEGHLLDRRSGLYDDRIDDHSRPAAIGTAKFTYDQGVMIGAMTALSRLDPGRFPLSDAIGLANRSMAYFKAHHTYGQPAFDAIWADNLLATAGLYRNAAFAGEARSSVELAIKAAPSSSSSLLTQGSEVTLRELSELAPALYPDLSYVAGAPGCASRQVAAKCEG